MDKEGDLFDDYEEGMANMDPTPTGDGIRRSVRIPWWWAEAKGWTHALKTLAKIALGIAVAVGIWVYLGPWSFLGLIPIPIWFVVLQNKLREEDITLWEFRIPDQRIRLSKDETITTEDRQIRPWYIPGDLWKHHKQVGTPFSMSPGVYICQYYDPEQGIIVFPERPATSNMVRYIDGLWNWVIECIPELETKLYLYRKNNKMMANRRAIELLERLHYQKALIQGRRLKQREVAQNPPGGENNG